MPVLRPDGPHRSRCRHDDDKKVIEFILRDLAYRRAAQGPDDERYGIAVIAFSYLPLSITFHS